MKSNKPWEDLQNFELADLLIGSRYEQENFVKL
jgi:hypothetical protein